MPGRKIRSSIGKGRELRISVDSSELSGLSITDQKNLACIAILNLEFLHEVSLLCQQHSGLVVSHLPAEKRSQNNIVQHNFHKFANGELQ
jgi:hypothetical protein